MGSLTTIEQRTLNLLSSLGWQTRINELDGDTEIQPGPNAEWEGLTRSLEAHFRTEARKHGISEVSAALDALLSSARMNRFHPIKAYLAGVGYDGGQYIEQLAQCFDNPDGLFPLYLRRWMIGSVRRVVEGGTQNRVLGLDGPQGVGKSKFCEWLIPPYMKRAHFRSSPVDPHDENHMRGVMTNWIWEVVELGSTTRKADVDALKGFLSAEEVKIRIPYDRSITKKPAMCSFIATFNNTAGVLNDPTGSRRFMLCEVKSIDWQQYTRTLTPDKVWGEASMLYAMGEPADLTPDEAKAAAERNNQYRVENPLQDMILEYFDITPQDLSKYTWTSDIEKVLQDPPYNLINPNTPRLMYKGSQDKLRKDLAAVLLEMGCTRGDKRKPGNSTAQKGYYGIQKK
jgi:predicted P-loop ATPase